MKALRLSRSCDHSGSSLGSNTAHWMPSKMLFRRKIAMRRGEM